MGRPERGQLEAPLPLNIAPTSLYSNQSFKGEDYGLKTSIGRVTKKQGHFEPCFFAFAARRGVGSCYRLNFPRRALCFYPPANRINRIKGFRDAAGRPITE